ncbi:DNA replication protein psf2 [Polyrhizophydium stewartii]|uniref:DNA replication protein psf2 n=1 Tax=Polyrhizophydium stewartii TaxID=2732419 RepID=A0ABR4NFC0_9FUNG
MTESTLCAEFLAESEPVLVLPKQRLPAIRLATATYGPFRPLFRTEVPLWLALALKAKDKCSIVPPTWLEAGKPVLQQSKSSLEQHLALEKSQPQFSDLPFHYLEIGMMLLDSAADDMNGAEDIRRLLSDLRQLRETKIRAGLEAVDGMYLQASDAMFFRIYYFR